MAKGVNQNNESYIDREGKKWAKLYSQTAVTKKFIYRMSAIELYEMGKNTYGPQWK